MTIADFLFPLALLGGAARLGQQMARRCGEESAAGRLVVAFVAATAWITLGGYLLSLGHLLASPWAWAGWSVGGALLAGRAESPAPRPATRRRWLRLVRARLVLQLMLIVLAVVAAANLALLLTAAPNSFDAMLYHLARVGYYLQQGSLAPYGANNPFQEEQAKNSAILVAGLLAVCGKSDILAGLPQFAAWGAGGLAAYAAARTFRVRPSAAAVAALAWMLLSIAWLEAVTAQNDLLIAAEVAAAFWALRRFGRTSRWRYVLLAGVAAGLALGTKASALTVLAVVGLAAGRPCWRPRVLALATLGALPWVLPAGYLENLARFGNPLGQQLYAQTLYHQLGLAGRAAAAGRNALRYGFDFFTLDQVPEDFGAGAAWARAKGAAVAALARHGWDLAAAAGSRMPFWTERYHRPDENLSYFGPFGLLLFGGWLWAWGRPRWRLTAAAVLGYFLIQCAAGPYDLIRGRQFLYAAALIVPATAGWVATWRRPGRAVAAALVVVAACWVIPGALYRNNAFLLPAAGRRPYWTMDRVEQMTGLHASYPGQRAFAADVPEDARVASAIDGYEYPLFGPRLSRHLVPVLGRWEHGEPLPPDAQWLVYTADGLRAPGDVALGASWYLRRLGGPAAGAARYK